jgi:hypothetical protein
MSKPLQARKDTAAEAARWHAAVFAMFGYVCWIHKARDPKSKMPATDAAHIIKRSRLGAALAYADPRLGRPLCRACHVEQELGLDPAFAFPLADRIDAAVTHNALAKSPLPVPTE